MWNANGFSYFQTRLLAGQFIHSNYRPLILSPPHRSINTLDVFSCFFPFQRFFFLSSFSQLYSLDAVIKIRSSCQVVQLRQVGASGLMPLKAN